MDTFKAQAKAVSAVRSQRAAMATEAMEAGADRPKEISAKSRALAFGGSAMGDYERLQVGILFQDNTAARFRNATATS